MVIDHSDRSTLRMRTRMTRKATAKMIDGTTSGSMTVASRKFEAGNSRRASAIASGMPMAVAVTAETVPTRRLFSSAPSSAPLLNIAP